MHYYKINNEIMQYSTFGNDIALIMHYRALFTMSGLECVFSNRVAIFLKFFNVNFCALGASIKLHFFQITALLWDTIQCRQLWTRTQHFSVGTISTDHWRNLYFLCLYLMYVLFTRKNSLHKMLNQGISINSAESCIVWNCWLLLLYISLQYP